MDIAGFRWLLTRTDDYSGYEALMNGNNMIKHLLCWDHVRRYFSNALEAIPEKERKNTCADQAMALIQKLYKIERRIKSFHDEKRLKVRLEESVETLENLKVLMDNEYPKLSSHSLT